MKVLGPFLEPFGTIFGAFGTIFGALGAIGGALVDPWGPSAFRVWSWRHLLAPPPFGTPVSRCQREPKGRAKVSKSAGKLKLGSEGRKKQLFDGLGVESSVFLNDAPMRMRVFQASVSGSDFRAKYIGFGKPRASKMEGKKRLNPKKNCGGKNS